MAAQAAMIDDAIIGLKRGLARQNPESGRDDPITQPTNRGNKLRANANYVHEGALGCMNGKEFYRKKAEHAGYKRDILQFNPPRYDSEGDELEHDDSDANADAEADEENPYADIVLQDLLGPLRHPSELADHPSMQYAYTSTSLKNMIGSVDKRLQEERHTLSQAKTLHRQLLGDASWIPCGLVESDGDDDIFGCPAEDLRGYDASADSLFELPLSGVSTNNAEAIPTEHNLVDSTDKGPPAVKDHTPVAQEDAGQDTEMRDAAVEVDKEDISERQQILPKPHISVDDDEPNKPGGPVEPPVEAMDVDGESKVSMENSNDLGKDGEHNPQGDAPEAADDPHDGMDTMGDVKLEIDGGTKDDEVGGENGAAIGEGSPEPPRRMTTRARANQTTNSHAQQGSTQSSTPSLSGTVQSASDADFLPLEPHPLFSLPATLHLDRNCGIPQQEADETRHLLWAYVQKQEVTVRLFAEMLEILRKAYRMKEDVWEWCKAEGHVGEMSDGEDWYDREKWGLAEGEDLKKGADEDEVEVDEGRATGKRGRGRRN